MNFGVSTWVWEAGLTTEKLEALLPKIERLGFDLVEIPIAEVDLIDYDRTSELLEEHDLGASVCAVIGPDRDFIDRSNEEKRKNIRNYLRGCIEAAETVGADRVAGPIYSSVGRLWRSTDAEREQNTKRLVGELRELAGYAGDHGVTLCLEPINRYETSFINTVQQGKEVVERVGHPNCGMLLDTFHMNIEEKHVPAAIRDAGEHIQHFHASGNDRGTPGSGHLPWPEIGSALRDVGYDGKVVIESFTPQVESIAKAASIWRSYEPTQDVIAEDGLATLQQHFASP